MNQENIENSTTVINSEEMHKNPKGHKKLVIIVSATLAIILIAVSIVMVLIIHDIEETKRLDATSVTLSDDLSIGFGEPVRVSNFIKDLQGSMVNDFEINTNSLGEQDITFEYINNRNKKRPYTFKIKVIDKVAPTIYGNNYYTVSLGYDGDLTNLMLSADDIDDHPHREIIGEYDLNTVGSYNIEYLIRDFSGNETRKPFMLNVIKPSTNSPSSPTPSTAKLPISEAIAEYRTDKTKVGIDVSSWQGDIDWKEVKSAGAEFAFIRIGYQVGYNGEYILDKYFTKNIEGAVAVGLPVGVYFYSYANNVEEAKNQAHWIIENLKNYKVELGIAFDWEDWGDFNLAGMSFYTINQVAQTFLNTVSESGYSSLLYSSLNYLRSIWQPEKYLANYDIWLAQYHDRPTYEKDFLFWQLSNTGRVDGIDGDVDLDIMYLE